jgi:hypothetical protein
VAQLARVALSTAAIQQNARPWPFDVRSLIIGPRLTSFRIRSMDLLLLVLEAAVALLLLLGIVWWTWPRQRKDKTERDEPRR